MLNFLSVDYGKLLVTLSSSEEFNNVILTAERKCPVLNFNQNSEVIEDFSGTFLTLWARKITLLKREFMYSQ